jgi:hypothetical protein
VDLILYSLAPVCKASDPDSKGTMYLLLAVGACCVNTKGALVFWSILCGVDLSQVSRRVSFQ